MMNTVRKNVYLIVRHDDGEDYIRIFGENGKFEWYGWDGCYQPMKDDFSQELENQLKEWYASLGREI